MADAERYRELVRPLVAGRKVVVCVDVVQGALGTLPLLRELGADRPFVLAGTRGTGAEPSAEEAEILVLETAGASTMMENIRAFEAALRDLPLDALGALDAYDPGREALVLGTLFTLPGDLGGRRIYGPRPRAWEALEDKLVADELFDAAGVDRAPSAVVEVSGAFEAARRLDRGLGTAWAGDARDGWWGGAELFGWVRSEEQAREAADLIGRRADRVRVMPFLEGIPCSIHGIVFPDVVLALRPVEMLTLRRPGGVLYAGLATFWDPPDGDRTEMREVAVRVGAMLRERVTYRGAFTVDGVLTADGFRPTELNPRPGAGMGPLAGPSGVPVGVLNKMMIEGEEVDWRPAELETLIVEGADAERRGACYTVLPGRRTETQTFGLGRREGTWSVLPEGEEGDGVLMLGPSGVGGFVRYAPDIARTEVGRSFAPVAVEIFAFTDAEFATGLGPLEAAREVR